MTSRTATVDSFWGDGYAEEACGAGLLLWALDASIESWEVQPMTSHPQLFDELGPGMLDYLHTQIAEDEQVLRAGVTDVGSRLRRLWILIPACLLMLSLCSFMSINNPGWLLLVSLSVALWGGLPVLIYRMQVNHLRRTLYAITDRRALIFSVGKPKKTESYTPDRITFIRPVHRKGGPGDLYFARLEGTGTEGWRGYSHGFLYISDVEHVADLMRRTFPAVTAK
jgi:hypothetical protein